MPSHESRARPSTVAFCCAALASGAITAVAALYYERLPMPDLARFLAFVAAFMTTAAGSAFAVAAALAARWAAPQRQPLAIGAAIASVAAVVWPVFSLLVIGRLDRAFELAAVAASTVALAASLGWVAYALARRPLARKRLGLPALVLAGATALALHATREREYTPPAPLAETAAPRVASPLPAARTNLLLITVDTLRADHLPMYGYERDTAPNLAELARRSIVFENAISQRTFTAPSLASILTATYPPTHGIHDNRSALDDSNLTLAELLKAKGFHTLGATGNPGLGAGFNFDQGFDVYESVDIRGEAEVYRLDPREATLLNRIALPLVDTLREQHFFLWLHYMDPHGPYIVPPRYRDLFADDTLARKHGGAKVPDDMQMYGPVRGSDPFFDGREIDFFISQYDAEIKFLDEHLGQLFARLREVGQLDDTLIVITADHGETMGEHRGGYFTHHHPYHHTLHVPLIFSHPRLPQGLRIERAVSLVDIVPTVLELLDLPPNPLAQGQSLAVDILGGPGATRRAHHFSMGTGRPGYFTSAVRTDSHKLIVDFRRQSMTLDRLMDGLARIWVPEGFFNPYHYRGSVVELYDLRNDPFERNDIASREPEVVAELSEVLWRWIDASHYEGRVHQSRRARITPEVDEALRALGYVE